MGATQTVVSTYRLQFSPYFRFQDATAISGYLRDIGISHVYASPIFEAVPGSLHGYDETDFTTIRRELGGEAAFRDTIMHLRDYSLGWIQDFVPNHMAMGTDNPYLVDIFMKGQASQYARYFDIDWNHRAFGSGRVCLPILARPYYSELKEGKLRFVMRDSPMLQYGDTELPVSEESYGKLIGPKLRSRMRYELYYTDNNRERPSRKEPDDVDGLNNEITRALDAVNGNPEKMDEIIREQKYVLRYWKTTNNEVNYRRFFAVNGLIGLRQEDREVFDGVHRKIFDMIREGLIDGVRIDHIDGLFDPIEYLRALRRETGDSFLVVEKILEQDESLDESWPVQGTTGYDFLGHVTPIFCSGSNSKDIDSVYGDFAGSQLTDEKIVESLKLEASNSLLNGVLDNLALIFWDSIREKIYGRDATLSGIREAIGLLMVHMPVYRTYISGGDPEKKGLSLLNSIMQASHAGRDDLDVEFAALGEFLNSYLEDPSAAMALQTLQQYMPAVFAKSVEDTLFFLYNRLISMNDVGMNPFHVSNSVDGFHNFNLARFYSYPSSMNALSTHDTKYSEDIRARINVLSEIPEEWRSAIDRWHAMNSAHGEVIGRRECPSRNEEYYFYQLLMGSLPSGSEVDQDYRDRLENALLKSLREAERNTSWHDPDITYERHYLMFVRGVLNNTQFMEDTRDLLSLVAFHGFLNSISQKILQMACPGIPDIYQGTEVWNFNFVDPDNRRKVDFDRISGLFDGIRKDNREPAEKLEDYLENYKDGRIKLLVTSKLLKLRKEFPDVFLSGSYIPVPSEGDHAENIVVFIRECNGKAILVAVPRLTVGLGKLSIPLGEKIWRDTFIKVPGEGRRIFCDWFSGKRVDLSVGDRVRVGDIMQDSPFTVLVSR